MIRKRLFHGWKVVLGGAAIQAMHSGFLNQAFGNYQVLLNREFGWSTTRISGVFSLMRVEAGLLAPAQGWVLDRFGTRAVMRSGVVLLGAGLVGLSQVRSFGQFVAVCLVASLGASLSGFLSVTTAVVRWFERSRAKALSLTGTGFAIGGIVTPGVVWTMDTFGWRWTAAGSGVVFVAVALPLVSLFGYLPKDFDDHVDGIEPGSANYVKATAEGVSATHFTAKQAIRTRAFWMISLGHASALFVVAGVMVHLSNYLVSEQGMTLQRASFVGGAMPLLQLIGQLGGGYLGDRVNKRLLASAAMIGHAIGLLLLTYATSEWMIWLFVPLHGLSWGVRGPLMQALRADYFGSTSFGQIMGMSAMIVMIGNVGGPVLAAYFYDRTGSYQLGFTMLAIQVGLGMVFFVLASPPALPVYELQNSIETEPML